MDALVDALSVTTGAMVEEVDEVEDVGTTMGPTRSGVISLVRTSPRARPASVTKRAELG